MSGNNQNPEPQNAAPSTGQNERERRRYFRIAEDIILMPREIEARDLPRSRSVPDMPVDPFTLSAALELLTQESRSILRRIEREQRDVADFLKVLERKIDMLGRAMLTFRGDIQGRPTQRVSLSASGLAFESEQPFAEGSVLELRMVLFPNLIGLMTYGRVVYCQQAGGVVTPSYQVAVDFIGLSDQDRELLIRHIVRRELQQIRTRKKPRG